LEPLLPLNLLIRLGDGDRPALLCNISKFFLWPGTGMGSDICLVGLVLLALVGGVDGFED
jgi:hypothetical protein